MAQLYPIISIIIIIVIIIIIIIIIILSNSIFLCIHRYPKPEDSFLYP